jgi:hypothetical protein
MADEAGMVADEAARMLISPYCRPHSRPGISSEFVFESSNTYIYVPYVSIRIYTELYGTVSHG